MIVGSPLGRDFDGVRHIAGIYRAPKTGPGAYHNFIYFNEVDKGATSRRGNNLGFSARSYRRQSAGFEAPDRIHKLFS